MSKLSATVYAFGFHKPKPLHALVIRNWAACDFIKFVFITDHAADWRAILPPDTSNIEVLQIDIEEVFRMAFPLFDVDTFTELKQDRGWMFTRGDFQMGGYLGCQLRPALSTLMPRQSTPFWGWIDNDVLINCGPLREHLNTTKAQLVLYPERGYAWEQFKLFSSELNTTMIYREMVDIFRKNRHLLDSPMEARFVYHIRDKRRYTQDNAEQSRIAIHWAYLDKIAQEKGPTANQYTVRIDRSASALTGTEDQSILFFNSDTQVKTFTDADVAAIERSFAETGSYEFTYQLRLVGAPAAANG